MEEWGAVFRATVHRGDKPKDWRTVQWASTTDGTSTTYTATVGDKRLTLARARQSPHSLTIVGPDGATLWDEWIDLFQDDTARFLAIIHADPAYLDWKEAAKILAHFMTDEVDPDYYDMVVVENNGWEDLIQDYAYQDEDEDLLSKMVLLDGTAVVLDEEEGEWRVRARRAKKKNDL